MKLYNVLFVFVVLLFSCENDFGQKNTESILPAVSSNSYKKADETIFDLEISDAKIGLEAEQGRYVFQRQMNKPHFFGAKETLGISHNKQYELQTDVDYSDKRRSDIEVVTYPISFSSMGLKSLKENAREIADFFKSLNQEYLMSRQENIDLFEVLEKEQEHAFNFLHATMADVFDKYFETLNEKRNKFRFSGRLDRITKPFDYKKKDLYFYPMEDNIVSPQITTPLSFEALDDFFELINKKRNYNEDSYCTKNIHKSLVSNFKFSTFLLKIKCKINECEKLKNDKELRGFIKLVCCQLLALGDVNTRATLKNSLPFFKTKNDFGILFRLLSEKNQSYLKQRNGEEFIEIINNLVNSEMKLVIKKEEVISPLDEALFTYADWNSAEGRKPLVYSKITNSILEFLPYVSRRNWLEHIVKGEDLLNSTVHRKYYPEASDSDMALLDIEFGGLGNKVELINGKPCGIFEIRNYVRVKLNMLEGYVSNFATLIAKLNDMKL